MSALIEEKRYNTRWWGAPYGKVTDSALFDLPRAEMDAALAPFSVVEHVTPDLDASSVAKLRRAGFWRADTQIPFKINLKPHSSSVPPQRVARLAIQSAAEQPFEIAAAALPSFKAERFWQLHGVTEEKVAKRFAFWSYDLIASHPETCLAFHHKGKLIGWFLGRRLNDAGIELTLAMTHPEASAMGGFVYEAALFHFASQGMSLGQAAFSASNPSVLNIYAGFGAKFLAARHVWLWQRPEYVSRL